MFSNRTADKLQHEKYKKLLGTKEVPKSFDKFVDLKYNRIDEWEELKELYRGFNNGTIIKNANQQYVKIEKHSGLQGKPNSITQNVNSKGGITRNYYDEDGWQSKQISNNHHNHAAVKNYGKQGEHAHDYQYDENKNLIGRPYRELTDEERKENADIL